MSNAPITCPMCEEGHLHPSRFAGTFKHGDQVVQVNDLECYRCDACGADPVLAEQIRKNQLKVADAKRRLDGLMAGDEVRAAREGLGLSQSEAAELFGGGANAFSKYERGDVLQSKAMDRLIRMAVHHPFILDELRRISAAGDDPAPAEPAPAPQRPALIAEEARALDAKTIEPERWTRTSRLPPREKR